MASFTNLYAKYYKNGTQVCDWKTLSGNTTMIAGYIHAGYTGENYVMVIKFELPTAAKSITFNLCNGSPAYYDAILQYKVTNTEDYTLLNAGYSTVGDGNFTVSKNVNTINTLTINRSLSAGVHYLYLWTGRTEGTGSEGHNYMHFKWFGNTSALYDESSALVYIDNGSSFDACEIWIDNGTGWDQYVAYIDNGSSWDECG